MSREHDPLAAGAVVIAVMAAEMERDAIGRVCDRLEGMPLAADPAGRKLIDALREEVGE
jgi:hypothetical protein